MEDHNMHPSQIGIYNPGRLSDIEIEKSFVARKALFDLLIQKVSLEKTDSIPQHYLIIGQRGMGKSTLLNRIAVELRKSPYNKEFIPLSFPEEQYNIDGLRKFWLNCLDALADALDKENNSSTLAKLDQKILSISKDSSLKSEDIFNELKAWCHKIRRRPVLLVDNLNLIFDRLPAKDHHELRAGLITNGSPILIGASSQTIEETSDYSAAFYDAFKIHHLKRLTFEEGLSVLRNLAIITGNKDFDLELSINKPKIATLYQLTGGTPRTLVMLYPIIQKGFSKDIQYDLDALMDVATPLYKSRFEELSDQMQVILDAVALFWDPINLSQLRDITGLANEKLSSQLKRLCDVGWLQKRKAYKAKGSSYEITERFFNIWYLMRRSSRRQKRELICLTRFLETFYKDDLEYIGNERLKVKINHPDDIGLNLALADALSNKELANMLRNKSYEDIIELSKKDDSIKDIYPIPENDTLESTLYAKFQETYDNESFNKALKIIDELIAIDDQPKYRFNKAIVLSSLGRFNESITAYSNLLNSKDKEIVSYSFNNLANIYFSNLKDLEKAEDFYNKAIEENRKLANPWIGLAQIARSKKKFIESEKSYKKALELDASNFLVWNELASLYHYDLLRPNKAEKAYIKSIDLGNTAADVYFEFARLNHYGIQNYKNAEKYYLEAIKENKTWWQPQYYLGKLYMYQWKNYEKAEKYYLTAVRLGKESPLPLYELGNLYFTNDQFENAKDCYERCLVIDESYAPAWTGIGNILQNSSGEYEKAKEYYNKAIALDHKYAYPVLALGNLYHLHFDNISKAKELYLKSIEIDDQFFYSWYWLGKLYRYNEKEFEKANESYNKALQLKDDRKVLLELALLNHYDLNDYENAKRFYLKVLELDQSSTETLTNLGLLYFVKLNEPILAEECFLSVLKYDQGIGWAHYGLGRIEENRNNYKKAENLYLKAIEVDKDDSPYFWNRLGLLYELKLKNIKKAEDAYLNGIKANPEKEYEALWFNLGDVRRKLNKYKESEEAYIRSNRIEKSSETLDSLGNLYQDDLMNYNEAEKAYIEALNLDPKNHSATINLMFLYRDKLGDIDKAYSLLDTLQDINGFKDTVHLNKALFSFYDRDLSQGLKELEKALDTIDGELSEFTKDDWYRFGAICFKLNYLGEVLKIFENKGYDKVLIPYFHALKSFLEEDSISYLESKAAEIRDPSLKIREYVLRYLS